MKATLASLWLVSYFEELSLNGKLNMATAQFSYSLQEVTTLDLGSRKGRQIVYIHLFRENTKSLVVISDKLVFYLHNLLNRCVLAHHMWFVCL